jgi:hypothetical protein
MILITLSRTNTALEALAESYGVTPEIYMQLKQET